MTSNLSGIDVTQLAADLTEYLYDRGTWDVGSGGPETVTEIAAFIVEWTSGDCQKLPTEEASTPNAEEHLWQQRKGPFCMPQYRRQTSETQ